MGYMTGDEKHSASATSTLDVLWVLYDRILRIDPAHPDDDARDRFLLSKGHGPMAYYAILAAKGFIDPELLRLVPPRLAARPAPRPQSHPRRRDLRGSLGHGLPLAVGMASGFERGATARVFCLVGDAELDEGSNHEAMTVARASGLDALTVIGIDNQSSTLTWPGGIAKRFETSKAGPRRPSTAATTPRSSPPSRRRTQTAREQSSQ